MVRKIVAFSATPRRKGNSDILADHALKGALEAGAEVQKIRLADLNIAGCRACMACKKKPGAVCAIKDDMAGLLDLLREAEALVLASPIYFFSVCSQMKAFLDRWYALFNDRKFDTLRGRQAIVALTYGDEDPLTSGAINALRMFEEAFAFLGVELLGCVHASCYDAGEVLKNKRVLEEAVALGRKLAQA